MDTNDWCITSELVPEVFEHSQHFLVFYHPNIKPVVEPLITLSVGSKT